jgi:hypothetical protein
MNGVSRFYFSYQKSIKVLNISPGEADLAVGNTLQLVLLVVCYEYNK